MIIRLITQALLMGDHMPALVLRNTKLAWLAALAIGALSTASPAFAQSNCPTAAASEPASTAEERRERLQRLSDDLNSSDPVVRLSTLETALLEGSASERRFALQTGLASSDSAMQDIALRIGFCSIRTIITQISDGENDAIEFFPQSAGSLRYLLFDYDYLNGTFKSRCPILGLPEDQIPLFDGQISGNNLSMSCAQSVGGVRALRAGVSAVSCDAALSLNSDGMLVGHVTCSPSAGRYAATASLF